MQYIGIIMNRIKRHPRLIVRPADALLPAVFLIAALLQREPMAFGLFTALYGVRLCALASANGLRAAFARQPSMRYVQGSMLLALGMQCAGAAIAALLLLLTRQNPAYYPLIACGLLLNIEHVFYEYLYAAGDGRSAVMCRGITALLTLVGLLLCAPRSAGTALPADYEAVYPLVTSDAGALVGLAISLTAGGKFRPKFSPELLRQTPLSLLHTFLFPWLAVAGLLLARPEPFTALPLYAGLMLYEPCRAPFRRTPAESAAMNHALLIVCAVAGICGALRDLIAGFSIADPFSLTCRGVILAALCTFTLFGNVRLKEED